MPMAILRAIAWLLLAGVVAPAAALAHSHKQKGLEIVHPWTPAMQELGSGDAPVYMTVKNRSGAADRLLGATTERAVKVELVAPASADSGPDAAPVATIDIPARGDLALNTKGPRLLLRGVKARLNAYDSFPLILKFEKAGSVTVEVVVEEAETTEPHKH
jgi:copper(I)-binding protein